MRREEIVLMYAMQACDVIMETYEPCKLPPMNGFHYHQGVFLSGMMKIWRLCGKEKYLHYLKEWVDHIIWPDGSIHDFNPGTLDDLQSGILLFELHKQTCDNRYVIALNTLLDVLRDYKCNEYGGFWHKEVHENQMWLDGLYMVGPLQAEYAFKFDRPDILDRAVKQIFVMSDHMMDPDTGLLYHAWDCTKKASWADAETGLSKEFWGRAMGWFVVAVLDILEWVPENHEAYEKIVQLEQKLLKAVMSVQDKESGMWYQVLDKGGQPGNWLETSCTALFSAAIAKAVHMNILEKNCMSAAWKGFEGMVSHSLCIKEGKLNIGGVCIGTGVCDYNGYISRPVKANDLHGVGAFLLMCAALIEESLS